METMPNLCVCVRARSPIKKWRPVSRASTREREIESARDHPVACALEEIQYALHCTCGNADAKRGVFCLCGIFWRTRGRHCFVVRFKWLTTMCVCVCVRVRAHFSVNVSIKGLDTRAEREIGCVLARVSKSTQRLRRIELLACASRVLIVIGSNGTSAGLICRSTSYVPFYRKRTVSASIWSSCEYQLFYYCQPKFWINKNMNKTKEIFFNITWFFI